MFDGFPILAGNSFTYGSYFGLNAILGGLAAALVATLVFVVDRRLCVAKNAKNGAGAAAGDSKDTEALDMTIIGEANNGGSPSGPPDSSVAEAAAADGEAGGILPVGDGQLRAARAGQRIAAWLSATISVVSVLCVAGMVLSYSLFWYACVVLAGVTLSFLKFAYRQPPSGVLAGVAVSLRTRLPWYITGAVSFAVLQLPAFFYVNSFVGAVLAWLPLAALRAYQIFGGGCAAPTGQRPSLHRLRPILRAESKGFLWLFLGCWLFSWLTADTCIGFYSPDAPAFIHYNVIGYSTRATRTWAPSGPSHLCGADAPQRPCHVYLSAAEAMSSSIFVNVHTALDEGQALSIRYCAVAHGHWPSPESFTCPDGQASARQTSRRFDANRGENLRSVHTALLEGLQPATEYAFVVESSAHPDFDRTVRWFRTMGADGATPATVALGGDTGHNPWGTAINAHVGANDADLAVVGGDVGYTNGMASCYQMWDAWLTM